MTIDKLVICSLLNIINMVTVAYRDLWLAVVLVPKGLSASWSIGRHDAFFVDGRAPVILDFAQQVGTVHYVDLNKLVDPAASFS